MELSFLNSRDAKDGVSSRRVSLKQIDAARVFTPCLRLDVACAAAQRSPPSNQDGQILGFDKSVIGFPVPAAGFAPLVRGRRPTRENCSFTSTRTTSTGDPAPPPPGQGRSAVAALGS